MRYALNTKRRSPFFDDFITRNLFEGLDHGVKGATALPAVNIKETGKDFQLELAVPGRKKADFNISIEKDVLSISAENQTPEEDKDSAEKYARKEFRREAFSRSFNLPIDKVDIDSVAGSYTDGVLAITIPKLDDELKKDLTRKVEIA